MGSGWFSTTLASKGPNQRTYILGYLAVHSRNLSTTDCPAILFENFKTRKEFKTGPFAKKSKFLQMLVIQQFCICNKRLFARYIWHPISKNFYENVSFNYTKTRVNCSFFSKLFEIAFKCTFYFMGYLNYNVHKICIQKYLLKPEYLKLYTL